MKSVPNSILLDGSIQEITSDDIVSRLEEYGAVVLRNYVDKSNLDEFIEAAEKILTRPALLGSPGYYRKDENKKTFDAFLLGRPAIRLVLDETVIKAAKAYLKSEVVLTESFLKKDEGTGEAYFPIHADFPVGWKMPNSSVVLSNEDLQKPVGVGTIMYLHDTTDGALCYAPGTHKMDPEEKTTINDRNEKDQKRINDAMVRLNGKRGDLMVFDDRGYHGPDLPSLSPRTILISDFYRVDTFGWETKSAIPAYINDLGGLSETQWGALGVGAKVGYANDIYHIRSFSKNYGGLYNIMKKLLDIYVASQQSRSRIKRYLRPFWRKIKPMRK